MKAIQIDQTNRNIKAAIESLQIVEKPIPKPGAGQVLVKIEAAPCHPSDLLFLQGMYGVRKTLPAVPGWEGAGRVVESGGGLVGWWLTGKRVACAGQSDNDGTWAEYYLADAKACFILDDAISMEQGATLLANPLTAVGLVEQAVQEGHRAIVQTAGCSQVARMVQVLARDRRIPLINIVRRDEQVELLRSAGEKWVFSTDDSNWLGNVKQTAKQLDATIAFDSVAGAISGQVLHALPRRSKLLVYGSLSEKPCDGISPLSLVFEEKKIEGFWITKWIKERPVWKTVQTARYLQKLIKNSQFETKIRGKFGFEEWKEALLDYHSEMTSGKAILTPY